MTVGLPPFQRLLEDMAGDVHRFLVATAGPNDADDCFQETFMAAMRASPRLRPDSNLRAWVLTIAHRKALDAHRARARGAVPVADPASLDGHSSGEEPTPARDESLWEAVGELPARQ